MLLLVQKLFLSLFFLQQLIPFSCFLSIPYDYLQRLFVVNSTSSSSIIPLILPSCICNAIIIVRCNMLNDFMTLIRQKDQSHSQSSQQQPSLPLSIALKILACIPAEMEACQDLTTSQVTEQLVPYLEPVLDTIIPGLEYSQHQQQSSPSAAGTSTNELSSSVISETPCPSMVS